MGKKSKKTSSARAFNALEIAEAQQGGESGSESDSGAIMDARKHMDGASEQDFEDEELDSDEALGSSDEYEMLDKASKNDDGYDSIDETELIPLSEVWDRDDKDLIGDEMVLEEAESESELESDSEDSDSQSEESDPFEGMEDEEVELSTVKNALSAPKAKEFKTLNNQTSEENQYSLPVKGKLSLSEMMTGIDEEPLLLKEEGTALSVPLPERIKQRHERKAAYELANEQVSKWEDTVQENRRAEVLKFPMNKPVEHNEPSSFQPSSIKNELEEKVGQVLEASALTNDSKESTFEQIATAKLTPEEMKKRQKELRSMRELLFREEQRAKRIKKIKSKSYHKVKKRERMRNEQMIEDSDPETDEVERAKERMSLKHKGNKWAQIMVKSGMSKDASSREEMEDMLQRGEKLRMKQLGKQEDDLAPMESSDLTEENQPEVKGVMKMDFMKKALLEERRANETALSEATLEGEDGVALSSSVNSHMNQGRRVYTPHASAMKESVDETEREVAQEQHDDELKNLSNKIKSNPWIADSSVKSDKVRIVEKNSSKSQKNAAKMAKAKKNEMPSEEILLDTTDFAIKDNVDSFQQQDLVQEAFAGDYVAKEFDREKKRVRKDEGDKEVDDSLPGWGSWSQNPKKSKKLKKIDGVVADDKRRDKKLKNVIINERVNKKNAKYQAQSVPYPFESREQYERSLRMPIGQEWTSRSTHQRLTMPRVIAKHGSVIDPLKAPFK